MYSEELGKPFKQPKIYLFKFLCKNFACIHAHHRYCFFPQGPETLKSVKYYYKL